MPKKRTAIQRLKEDGEQLYKKIQKSATAKRMKGLKKAAEKRAKEKAKRIEKECIAQERRLVNFTTMDPEMAHEYRRKGALAAAEAKREKKRLQQALQILLDLGDADTGLTNAQKLAVVIFNKAMSGDVAAFNTLRDTAGEVITQKQELAIERPQIIIGGIDTNAPQIETDNEDVIDAEVVKEIGTTDQVTDQVEETDGEL